MEQEVNKSTGDCELLTLFNLLKAKEPELLRRLLHSCASLILKDDRPSVQDHLPERERFLVKTGLYLTSIHINQVAFFYCENKTVYLKTKDGKNHILRASIEELANTVPSRDFFRLNRQVIASRQAVKKVIIWINGTLRVDLSPGDHSPIIISKLRAPQFRQWLGE